MLELAEIVPVCSNNYAKDYACIIYRGLACSRLWERPGRATARERKRKTRGLRRVVSISSSSLARFFVRPDYLRAWKRIICHWIYRLRLVRRADKSRFWHAVSSDHTPREFHMKLTGMIAGNFKNNPWKVPESRFVGANRINFIHLHYLEIKFRPDESFLWYCNRYRNNFDSSCVR